MKIKFRYVRTYVDRLGKLRCYYTAPGKKRVPLPLPIGGSAFMQAYEAAKGPQEKAAKAVPGSFHELLQAYFASPDYQSLSLVAKGNYRRILEGFAKQHGDKPVALLGHPQLIKILGKMGDRPQAANNLLKRLRTLLQFGVKTGLLLSNPAIGVKGFKVATDGLHSWSEAEIFKFEKCHPTGSKARLALLLLLTLGQRKSDVVKLGPANVQGGTIRLTQQKTKTSLILPIHDDLKAAIAGLNGPTFLMTEFGKSFTANGFGNWFRERCDEAGLPQCASHGLRKAAGRRLAEAGALPTKS